MDLKKRAKKLKILVPAIYLAMKRKETPIIAKIFAGLTVAYALSPIDLIPDFILVVGYLDDLIILLLLASVAIKFIPKDVMEECKKESINLWSKDRPNSWLYAIPIFIFWVIIFLLILKKFEII
ncbi:MAG: DUF1232 domain-containing protein [Tissierellia bacterium]|nr:DUF1232 domain-containing protein [Tissierellia bacterium]